MDIVHRAIVSRECQKDLAKEYRVSQVVISVLVTKVRRQPTFLRELRAEAEEKEEQRLRLADFISERLSTGQQLKTVKQVRDDYEAIKDVALKEHQVRKVMKEDVGLSYKKITRLAP